MGERKARRERVKAPDRVWDVGGGNVFSELQHFSLPRAITESIYGAILSGRLKPGERITEMQASRAMGVSRASIREAFQQLRAAGVLRTRRRKTYVSGSPSGEELRDVYRVRGICEGLAAESARGRIQKGELMQLEGLIGEMERASRRMDLEGFAKADLAFHTLIWEANRKEHLKRILAVIATPYHPFLVALLRKSGSRALLRMTGWHRQALEDLRRFEGEELIRRTEEHYQKVGEEFIRLMQLRSDRRRRH